MPEKLKALLVDDSSLVRKIMLSIFKNDSEVEIADEAVHGIDALEKLKDKEYDIILLDFEMPEMNGLEFLEALKKESSINKKPPVIVFSSLSDTGSKVTIQCLLAGAKDYMLKPTSRLGEKDVMDEVKTKLKEKIKALIKKKNPLITHTSNVKTSKLDTLKLKQIDLVLIGSSTGGPNALEVVLTKVPKNFPLPILIVQHMPPGFTKMLANSLNERCSIPVTEVTGPTKVESGKIYIAGGAKHMLYEAGGTLIHKEGELVNFCIPAVDVLFKSVAKNFKGRVLSIVLTGMGKDGAEGVKSLKNVLDCYSIVQDEASSVVWAMPKAVYEEGLSDVVLPLDQIGVTLADVRNRF